MKTPIKKRNFKVYREQITEVSYIAENIANLRRAMKINQEDLAKEIGITRSSVGAYEEGRAEPPILVLKRMSKVFGVTIDDLINKKVEEPNMVIDLLPENGLMRKVELAKYLLENIEEGLKIRGV